MKVKWLVVAALACACGKASTDAKVEPTAASSTVPGPIPTSAAASHSGTSWRGTYKSAAGTLYIPPAWKDVHWKVKETGSGLGEGVIAVQLDPANGRVVGTLDGPLGPAEIDGLDAEGTLTAAIARKDPTDQGFMGTIVGSIANGRAEGTMYLSLAEASAIRTATFTMSPDPAIPAPR
jgi:hypothetical protein